MNKKIYIQNNLNFLEFTLDINIKNEYKQKFPDDTKMINLNTWKTFERNNINTFREMYQFWLQKEN